MTPPIRVLYVDDSALDRELVRDVLEREHTGFVLTEARSRKEFETRLAEGSYDLVLSDFNILGFEGLQVIEAVRAKDPHIPVVILTGTGSEDIAVEAMKKGAADYVIKRPPHMKRLPLTIEAALEKMRLEKQHEQDERLMKESEEAFRALFENSLDATLLTAPDGSILRANPAACRMFGCTEEEIIQGGRDGVVDTTDPRLPVLLEQRRVTGSAGGDLNLRRKDGTVFPAEVSSSTFLNAKGEQRTSMSIRDISVRMQAEGALRDGEVRYRDLYEKSPDMLISVDPESGRIVQCNETCAQITGYSKKEIVGRSVLDMYHPDCRGQAESYLQIFRKTGEISDAELQVVCKDGSTLDVILSAKAVRDDQGKILYSRSSWHDITERKKAEEALRQSEQKYRLIVENTQEVIYQTDMEGRVIFGSPSSKRLLGYAPEELLGTRLSKLYAIPEERSRFLQLLTKSGSVTDFEAELVRKDGGRVWVSTNARLLTDEKGTAVGVEGITRDVSARKEAEESLRESEERFRLAFDNANTGVCLVDLHGRLLRVNDQMCEIFGYSRSELEAMTVNDIAHPEDAELSLRFMQRAVSGAVDRTEFEKRYIHKQGHVVWRQVSSSLVRDKQGNPLYFISHVQDLTERKTAGEAARDSEERYRHLVEMSPDGIAVHQEGSLVFVNPAGARMIGAESPEKLIGKPIREIVHPDYWEKAAKRIQRMMKGETGLYPVEDCYVKLDGTAFPVEVMASPLTYGGKPAVQVVVRDITDRRKAEEALKHSEAMLKGVLAASPIGIVLTRHSTVQWANEAWEKMFGFSDQSQYKGQPTSIMHPSQKDYESARGKLYGDLTFGDVQSVEATLSRNDGAPFDAEIRISLLDASDPSRGTISVISDISQRKRAEEVLRESQERYQTLFNDSKDAVFVTSREGELIEANPAYSDLFGYKKEEMIGSDVRALYADPSDREHFVRAIESIGFLKDYPLTLRTRDGKDVQCLITSSLRRKKDETVIGYHGIIRDRTEQMNLQRQLLQAQKMEAIGTLAGRVAHDFNNILQVALGYSELILSMRACPSVTRPTCRRYMNLQSVGRTWFGDCSPSAGRPRSNLSRST